jgi:hypothetical protein
MAEHPPYEVTNYQEEELRALIERAYAQGLDFDYDREKQAYVLIPGKAQE